MRSIKSSELSLILLALVMVSSRRADDCNTPLGGSSSTTTIKPYTTATSTSSTTSSSNTTTTSSQISLGFDHGTGIGSWFRTDLARDYTNGRSWCETEYKDDSVGYAISVGRMKKSLGNDGDDNEVKKAYCGQQARLTDEATGVSILAYMVDGFDDDWCHMTGNTDLTVPAFTEVYGSFDNNRRPWSSNSSGN